MIVFNAGIPRSGTIFVNAIIRHLVGEPIIQTNPHGPELYPTVLDLLERPLAPGTTAIVHTHSWNEPTEAIVRDRSDITGFLNYRDPRDACVSWRRLRDLDLEDAASEIAGNWTLFEITGADTGWQLIRYEDLIREPARHAAMIATELGLDPDGSAIDAVLEATSLERHRAIMHQVTDGTLPALRRRPTFPRELTEDPKTLVTDRHIQSGVEGRWRDELTGPEQDYVNKCFEQILVAYGYPER